jgi:hypothetical protein
MGKIFQKLLGLIFFIPLFGWSQIPPASFSAADSLFSNQRFSEARDMYAALLEKTNRISKADLLKLAFMEEARGNPLEAIFYLHQFYLLQPEKDVKLKIEEMADQNKYQGYSVDEADYAYFLYRTYSPYVEKFFQIMALVVFLLVVYRKIRGISLGYSPIFTLIFLVAAAYFTNFSLPYKRAILSGEKTLLMTDPSAGSSVVAVLEKGHRVEWMGEQDVWLEIRWNEKTGWVKKSSLLFFL